MLDFKPKARAHGIAADDGKRYILLHTDKPAWTVVNAVGYNTLSLCDGCSSVEQIASALSRQYGMSGDQVLSDVKFFVNRLVQGGFVFFPPAQPEPEPYEQIPALKKVDLNITENCNLRCRHCGVTDGSKKKDYLTTRQIFRIIDEAKEAGVDVVTISGGEPLLREDCLSILSYAAQRVKTALCTNGTLIDDKTAQVLADLNVSVQISLDGPQASVHDFMRGKGAFVRTMKALDLLGNSGVKKKVILCATVSRNNLGHIPALLTLAAKIDPSQLRFVPLQKMGMARSHWDELAPSSQEYIQFYNYLYQEALSEFPELQIGHGLQGFVLHRPPGQALWCRIGQILTIDDRGDLYPCPLLTEPEFRLGNVQEVSLQQALESPVMKRTWEMCLSRKDTILECRICPWKNFCQGGCAGSVYRLKGTVQAVDDLCGLRKKLYPQTIFDRAARKSCAFYDQSDRGEDEGDIGA